MALVPAWQRDRASAPFERVGEPWWHSLALWLGAIVAIASLAIILEITHAR